MGHRLKLIIILEAKESKRLRIEDVEPIIHEDHVARKGTHSLQYYSLVHKPVPMPQAVKIPEAKAAVDKEHKTLEKISAWNLAQVRHKSDVIDEARNKDLRVHVVSLLDLCHLNNAEFEKKHQKYKGRVVLWSDIVKDDRGSYAVFTEEGSSASQMTAAQKNGHHFRVPSMRRAISRCCIGLHSSTN